MAPPKLVIFDCDGVLVDSEPISARVASEILNEHGWLISPAEVMARFKGCTDEHWREVVAERIPAASLDDWHERNARRYEEAFESDLKAVAGVVDAIAQLSVPFCVASNGSHAKIRRNLQRVGLVDFFQGVIFSAEDVPRGKPAPDLFLHAAATMGVAPEDAVVVEDSRPGLAAASAAGMRCLVYASDEFDLGTSNSGTLTFDE